MQKSKFETWRTINSKWNLQIIFLMILDIKNSPLDCKIKPVSPKGNQPWIFIGRTDAEAPILCPSDAKSQLIGKDPDTGEDRRQEKKWVTENEMVGWLNGHEFEQTLGDGEGQGNLVCCNAWGCRVRHVLANEQQQTHHWWGPCDFNDHELCDCFYGWPPLEAGLEPVILLLFLNMYLFCCGTRS